MTKYTFNMPQNQDPADPYGSLTPKVGYPLHQERPRQSGWYEPSPELEILSVWNQVHIARAAEYDALRELREMQRLAAFGWALFTAAVAAGVIDRVWQAGWVWAVIVVLGVAFAFAERKTWFWTVEADD